MALQYPSWQGIGVDSGAIMDAFNGAYDRSRMQKYEREAPGLLAKLYEGGVGAPNNPMSLSALGQQVPQQAAPQQMQTYAPPQQADAATQRIQSALGETQANGAPSVGQMRQYIAQAAMQRGIDPGVAIRVAQSEGLADGVWQSNLGKEGRREPSYGPFQLLVGGGETGYPAGMGNDFMNQTGLDPADPSNWQKTIDFALDGAAKNGWGAWYGAAKAGIGNRQGIGGAPQQPPPQSPQQLADASGQIAVPQQQGSQQEFGLPDRETMQALFANPVTRPLAINLAQSRIEAMQNQNDPQKALEYQIAVEKLNQLRNGGSSEYAQRASAAQQYGLDPNSPEGRNFILSGKLPEARGGAAELGLNPQYGVDESGNPALIQIGKDGKAVRTALPDGITLSKEPIKLDAGTHFVLLDPITRQPVGQIEKNVAGEAAATAGGKASGEAAAGLPSAEAGFQSSVEAINQLLGHPGLNASVGTIQGQVPDAIAGALNSDVADFRSRLKQAQGQTFLRAFESLKGGGAITEVEGLKAEQAIGRLNQAVSEKDFKQALTDLKGILERGITAYRRKAGGAVPASTSGSNYRDKYGLE